MSRDPARAATQFFGGRMCLDFANTMDWRTSDAPQELIPDYAALLSWSKARRTLAAKTVAKLQAQAALAADAAAAARCAACACSFATAFAARVRRAVLHDRSAA